jgi:hypothetical protein
MTLILELSLKIDVRIRRIRICIKVVDQDRQLPLFRRTSSMPRLEPAVAEGCFYISVASTSPAPALHEFLTIIVASQYAEYNSLISLATWVSRESVFLSWHASEGIC